MDLLSDPLPPMPAQAGGVVGSPGAQAPPATRPAALGLQAPSPPGPAAASTPAVRSPGSATVPPIMVCFTLRGMVRIEASQAARAGTGGGGGGGGWSVGGMKKALGQVVGDKMDTMQITIVTNTELGQSLLFSSEMVPDSDEAEEVHFSRVAQLPAPGAVAGIEYLRLALWLSAKPGTGYDPANTKRVLMGELTLSLGELAPLASKGPSPYVRRLQSEKFQGAEVLIWPVAPVNMNGISMAPGGVASVVPAKFNPMVERFSFIKYPNGTERPGPVPAAPLPTPQPQIDLMTGLPIITPPQLPVPSPPPAAPSSPGSVQAPPPAPPVVEDPLSSAVANMSNPQWRAQQQWQAQLQPHQAPQLALPSLVTVQEVTVEPKFSVSLPLELLRPLYAMLKSASQAWQARVEMERIRQGYFNSNAEAFREGRVLVKVNITEAQCLDAINIYMGNTAAAANNAGGGSTAISPMPDSQSTDAPSPSPSPPPGMDGGGGVASGGSAGNTPSTMNLKKLGSKAISMAKNAGAAASRAALSNSGAPPERSLKHCNFFAKVVHVTPAPPPPEAAGETALQRRARTRVVGKTNTEYGTVTPVWNSNRNRALCPHSQPRTQHMVSGSARVEVNAASEGVVADGSGDVVQGLDLCFYVKASDLDKGHLLITLYQETYSRGATYSGKLIETAIGDITIPLSTVTISPDDGPCHTNVQWYPIANFAPSPTSAGVGTPAVLVGLCIQDSAMNDASDEAALGRARASAACAGAAGGAAASGDASMDVAVMYLDGNDSDDSDDSDDEASTTAASTTSDGAASGGGGERVGVAGGPPGARRVSSTAAGGGGAASASPSVSPSRSAALTAALLSKWRVSDCYEWMRHIGKGGDMIDIPTLAHMYEETEYPLSWCEAHARAVSQQAAMVARIGKLYSQMLADQRTFRGSQQKKDKDLQFMATNLHAQIWSVLGKAGTPVAHHDMTTTGAPSAHALGFKHGGLVSLEGELSALKQKVLKVWATTALAPTNPTTARTEAEQEAFSRLLMDYEMKSLAVSMRRAVVTSQALSITACNFATKLEMLALGTLSRGEELSAKWGAVGYLISFEGLLSVQGKEQGMVEDTVAAMSILRTYTVHVCGSEAPSGLDITLDTEGHVLRAAVGRKILARLPSAMQSTIASAGAYRIPIVPVFFTQGIDIQQSAANYTNAKTRGSFQADINVSSFNRLNAYVNKFHSQLGLPPPPDAPETHPSLARLQTAVMNQQTNQKNTAVLLESERAVQMVGGGRVTFCKSGKDRTAMSVTLEESIILVSKYLDGVGGEARALRIANMLRVHGTRIAVAEKNIGYPLYSFNTIQRQFIPELYRAPLQTIQDVLTSFQKRDS